MRPIRFARLPPRQRRLCQALQKLQAFRANSSASLGAVRVDMIIGIRAQGGEVKEWTDRTGVEIRASVLRVTEFGQPVTRDTRDLGSGGPGWVLRAIVSGGGNVGPVKHFWQPWSSGAGKGSENRTGYGPRAAFAYSVGVDAG
ncbi:DUF3710 domain-containing protein [Streptomyces sp. NPDC002669]|uniref:DUF3710 domain-containing protein n=1 Tax=Streptomyces sp. NPDC002669 TaxID=3364658 RepID=UPI0036847C5E